MEECERGDGCDASEAVAECASCTGKKREYPQNGFGANAERVAALEDQLLRVRADFDNYRKRVARDHAENMQLACESLIQDLLPILDNFSLGLKAAERTGSGEILQGFDLIWQQLQQLLSMRGLSPVGTAGEAFDSNIADALTLVPRADVPEGHVVDVIRVGYFLGKKLLRPAAVTVSSGPAADKTSVDEESITE
ncbi:MAG: nucleotide exchange factor GrpE [Puniceicoccales bacterium]|jgi:molecular chaperone GrpE|nr:nucleotide exchange factor GrpE [Puniceicoccales bacterium]